MPHYFIRSRATVIVSKINEVVLRLNFPDLIFGTSIRRFNSVVTIIARMKVSEARLIQYDLLSH